MATEDSMKAHNFVQSRTKYGRIPARYLQRVATLGYAPEKVYLRLLLRVHAFDAMYADYTLESLSEETKIHKLSVKRAVDKLAEERFIKIERSGIGGHASSLAKLRMDSKWTELMVNSSRPVPEWNHVCWSRDVGKEMPLYLFHLDLDIAQYDRILDLTRQASFVYRTDRLLGFLPSTGKTKQKSVPWLEDRDAVTRGIRALKDAGVPLSDRNLQRHVA